MSDVTKIDSLDSVLEENTAILKNCQKEHNITDCLMCKNILGCDIRNNYVNAVYKHMSKGHSGEFEF